MGKYRELGTGLDRVFRNNLNGNFDDIGVDVDDLQTQINTLVVSGDSSVEAAQARVEADGTANATLKARLDKKEAEFESQLAEKAKHITSSIKYLSKEQQGNETLSDTLVRLASAGGNHIVVDVPVTLMNTIVLEDNTVIHGLNTITEIRAGANLDKMVTFTQACTHFEIKNILFHGNFNTNTVNYGLYFTSPTNKACPACYIQNVLVRGVTGIGYYSSSQILGLVMDNVHYEFCQGGGIISQGHDVIINNIYVSDSAKVSGQGVILSGNNAKNSNIKVFVCGNTTETYTNTLSGVGSQFIGVEFQENQKGTRLYNLTGSILNLVSDKNNVAQLSETADFYLDGVHYSNITTIHINRAVQGIPNKYGIKDIYTTHNQISANTDNSVVWLYKSSSKLPTTDFNNPFYIFGNEQFTPYTDGTTGGTVKYVGNGRFIINGTFASQSINVFATYSNTTDTRTFNNVVLSLLTTGNDELTLTFVKPDDSTVVCSPTNILDVDTITFRNVILKVSTSKTYSNAIIDLRVVTRNNQQMSIM
jgi:hypothetical protein